MGGSSESNETSEGEINESVRLVSAVDIAAPEAGASERSSAGGRSWHYPVRSEDVVVDQKAPNERRRDKVNGKN